jgi:hypothetical protein
MPPPRRPSFSSGGPPWWLIIAIAAIIGFGYYWLQREQAPTPERAESPAPPATAQADGQASTQPGQPAGPAEQPVEEPKLPDAPPGGPKYPLPAGVAKEGDPSLPELARSDAPILEALTGIAPRDRLGQFGNLGDYTRRIVVTVDNLPRELVPAQLSVVRRIPGALAVGVEGGEMTLLEKNYARYNAFVAFAESLGPKSMVSIYLRFYPLLQQEYRAMGYPKGHFHDRVIEAIDDMLAAPELDGPIRLVQPKVHYRFADPKLESLSAGRKIMIRVGPENAARLKKILRAIRAELVS